MENKKEIISEDDWNNYFPMTGPSIAKFSTTWCGPCKAIKPRFDMHAKNRPEIIFLSVPSSDVLRNLSTAFQVNSYPTFIAFQDGKEISRFAGADPGKLQNMVQSFRNIES